VPGAYWNFNKVKKFVKVVIGLRATFEDLIKDWAFFE
jgi:hypothetical protein